LASRKVVPSGNSGTKLAEIAHPAALDLPLGLAGQTRVDQKPVVLGAFAIGLLNRRLFVADVGFDDRRFEIVQHDAVRHAAKEFERVLVAQQPGRQFLIKHDLGVLMPTPGQP
jgi:hypothetical protein